MNIINILKSVSYYIIVLYYSYLLSCLYTFKPRFVDEGILKNNILACIFLF